MTLMHQNELTYWKATCSGDEEAFGKLYSILAHDLFRYGYKICANKEMVQDGVQDIFLTIWNKRSDLFEVASPRFYLYKSLRNKLLREIDSDRRVCYMDDILVNEMFADEAHPEKNWIHEEDSIIQSSKLKTALEKLSSRQQEVIQLRYYHDFSAEEIGKIMDIHPQSVRNLQNRAMQQLRTELPYFTVALLKLIMSGQYWIYSR